jgi:UDP-N-acetyl-D-glucosamine dehydrogenase
MVEIAMIPDKLYIDIWNAIDAAATKPFGFMSFYPCPGPGSHCIPVDPTYLSWKAEQTGIETQFIDLANKINRGMPEYVVQQTVDLLNDRAVPVSTADVLVLGAAYKANVSDVREPPALDIIKLLSEKDATVRYHDPYVPALEICDERYESVPLETETVEMSDCVLIVTDHDTMDIKQVVTDADCVFDTRNTTAAVTTGDNVHLL